MGVHGREKLMYGCRLLLSRTLRLRQARTARQRGRCYRSRYAAVWLINAIQRTSVGSASAAHRRCEQAAHSARLARTSFSSAKWFEAGVVDCGRCFKQKKRN